MKFNKNLLTTILTFTLFFIVTSQVSSHMIIQRPPGNFRPSGYRPEQRANYVVPYEKHRTLNDFINTDYYSITDSARNTWNNGLSEIMIYDGTNTNNSIQAFDYDNLNVFAFQENQQTNGRIVTMWRIVYNDTKMRHLNRTDQNAVAIHEFGHTFGLTHVDDPFSIMRHDPTTSGIKVPNTHEFNAVDWINSN